MKLDRLETNTYHIVAGDFTAIDGPGISFAFEDPRFPTPTYIPLLHPADAWALGQELQKVARKAGYVPPQT